MKDGREDGRKNAEKILRGAQAARLRFLFAALFTAALFCFLCGLASALLFRNVGGRVAAAALFCLFAGLSGWAGYFLCIYAAIRKNADGYALAVTESASFECFGPFLAMDVRFFEGGNLREGRSRFVFSARDAEAWQGVPLLIAYLPAGKGENPGRKRGGKRGKPDVQENALVVILGSDPCGNFSRKAEKSEKGGQNRLP